MSGGWLGVGALAVYLIGLLAVSELARRARRASTPVDHFLAGRELGTFVLFLTLYATAYSGNSLIGYPGRAYASGFSFVMSIGFMLSTLVVFHALAPRLRPQAVAFGFVTPGDWIRTRFSGPGARALRVAVGTLMALALANFLLAQLKAMGDITSLVTAGRVPYPIGVIGLAIVILAYENRGGMRAVAWTDAAQGLLMIAGLFAMLAWLLEEAGGLAAITRSVASLRPEATAVPSAKVDVRWFSTTILLALGTAVYPQAIQRIFAARSGRHLRDAFIWMTFMPLFTVTIVTLIGLAAIGRVDVGRGVASDGVMPLLLNQWAEQGGLASAGALIVFLGALSAIMSTADSCLLSLGSLLSRDVLDHTSEDAAGARFGKWLAAGTLLATVPLALQRDFTLWRLIELKMEILVQCAPALLIGLHWSRLAAGPTLLGIIAGTGLSAWLTLADSPSIGGLHAGVLGLGLNVAIAVVGSLVRGSDQPAAPLEGAGTGIPNASAR